ncbi:hypothetical protein CSKR_100475 [Clonorchis sinensis]|uniref:Uncharacterized protein n=1 Tax=Clonorchis sinensis TaxID=79923 RepID=A0A419Q9F6_CLOSI|nr:hypothetical protein CSKR_100475 [Clonorchis sinensis]
MRSRGGYPSASATLNCVPKTALFLKNRGLACAVHGFDCFSLDCTWPHVKEHAKGGYDFIQFVQKHMLFLLFFKDKNDVICILQIDNVFVRGYLGTRALKAFQRSHYFIDHEVTWGLKLQNLESYGIQGNILRWIMESLSEGTFRVKAGSTYSSLMAVSIAIPQGSVLRPLLIPIYRLQGSGRWIDTFPWMKKSASIRHSEQTQRTPLLCMARHYKDRFKQDLGIWLSSNVSLSVHHKKSAQRAFAVPRMIR